MQTETIQPKKAGQKKIRFKKGALHQQLGIPADKKIPSEKMAAAKAGNYGKLAAARAIFAQNVLTGKK